MASIRERKKRDGSSVFAVQVRQRGFPAITATFPTIRMAQRWAKTKEAEMIEGRHFRSPEARRRTLAEAVDRVHPRSSPREALEEYAQRRSAVVEAADRSSHLTPNCSADFFLLETRGASVNSRRRCSYGGAGIP
jgi:hypothetical protein